MPAYKRSTTAQVKIALKKCTCNTARAAEMLGCSFQALHRRINESKELQRFIAEVEQTVLAHAIGNVAEDIVERKDVASSKWWAERKGRHLGFSTKVELGADDQQVAAFLQTLGADPAAYRAAILALGGQPPE